MIIIMIIIIIINMIINMTMIIINMIIIIITCPWYPHCCTILFQSNPVANLMTYWETVVNEDFLVCSYSLHFQPVPFIQNCFGLSISNNHNKALLFSSLGCLDSSPGIK